MLCLRFENKPSPQANNRESFGGMTQLVKIERELGLYACYCGLRTNHLVSQRSYFTTRIRQYRSLGRPKQFATTLGMVISLPINQRFVAE